MDHIAQFYLKITPCLPFLCKCSADGATLTEVGDIQLQLTTHLSTPKGWKAELAYINGHLSATGQAQDKEVRRPKTDVLLLCHGTNQGDRTGISFSLFVLPFMVKKYEYKIIII